METKQQLAIIQTLLPHLDHYRAGLRVNFGPEDKTKMQEVYFDIYQQRINTGCPSCIINGLEFLQAYQQRESAKIQPAPEPVQEETTSTEVTVLDIKKPCKKCGKNKSK